MKRHVLLLGFLLLFAPLLYAQSSQDDLDAYVKRLKDSYATGGSETAFMSVGSDFLYAQGYFEAKNYSSAADGFMRIVGANKDHVFANYQLAIALIRQNDPYKTRQAEQYLDHAFKLNPSLKERYAKDVPVQQTSSAGQTEKTEPKSTENSKFEPTKAAPIGLEAYIDKLKYSFATGGKETQMLSAGQEAMAGIQYYEKGEYGSAETRFNLSLTVDAENPYVNYLKAVSMAAQGKEGAAKPFLQKAVAGDASLQQRYAGDLTSAKAAWSKFNAFKEVKTTPTAKITYGGPLQYGNYTCHQSVWNGPNASPAYRFDYKGYFALKKDGTYRWLDNGGTGKYRYNPKTGAITWLSGPMKNNAPTSSRYQPGTKVAQVTVEFSKDYRWECGCNK
ncbi:hypothetical protein [Rufibacter aurantiacus]|uniref:hypothetical protein n=1 Tax=Rufibacter aurantiacus TaxID=2817374 RepID=UPI001B30731E|nr:hypothetical protein [Rufibacter aurantiacus]